MAEVDEIRYAQGEAMLGWLNAAVHLDCMVAPMIDWEGFCNDFISRLRQALCANSVKAGHLKLFLLSPGGHCVANLTDIQDKPSVRSLKHSASNYADMVINARVQAPPHLLETIVRRELLAAADARNLQISTRELRCLTPGRSVSRRWCGPVA